MSIKTLSIDQIDLSVRSLNALQRAGVYTVGDMLQYNEETLHGVRNLGAKSISEILDKIEEYKNKAMADNASSDENAKTVFSILYLADYRTDILTYVRANDIDITNMGLSNRPKNQLLKNDYTKLSEIIFLNKQDFLKLPAMGVSSADEIMSKLYGYLREHESSILATCNGDGNANISDEFIEKRVLVLYQSIGFGGLSYDDIKNQLTLPIQLDDTRLKAIIGRLIAKNELEYVDYRCYRVYDKLGEYLNLSTAIKERSKDIIQKRLDGMTLEAIAIEYGLTRERVRQIIKKDLEKVKSEYASSTGKLYFDEDYYGYFYETYDFDKKDGSNCLGVPEYVWNYQELNDIKQGDTSLELALEDATLDAGFKLRVKSFFNRDSLYIDGEWVRLKRGELEAALVKKYCKEDTSYDSFVEIYNTYLKEMGVKHSEDIYITESTYRSRWNVLSGARFVLWKQNSVMRYYDIDCRDYTELIDTLKLASYENIELSTLKLVTDYHDLMKEYDIRDQYELHNLLRKIIPEGSFHDFHCERMPEIRFGEFDRDQAIFEIIKNNAPITVTDLCELIKQEYGYESGVTMAVYLKPFAKYYHQGVYSVDQKKMPEERLNILKSKLVEDFYTIDYVEFLYKELFPEGDIDEVNAYNIKSMGYMVFSKCILKNHNSLEAYFEHILTVGDIVDIREYKKKYDVIQGFYIKLMDIRCSLRMIEFEPDQFISFNRLQQFGVNMDDIHSFCDEVYDFLEDGEYFTIQSIKKNGFEDQLFDLGFSNLFYASLMLPDKRFAFRKMYGTVLLCKTTEEITKESFVVDRIIYYGVIDTFDLLNEMSEDYGCAVDDKWAVVPLIQNTTIYYDKILDRLYANKDLYYDEIDKM